MRAVFPIPVEDFIFSTCKVLKTRGLKSEVSILVAQNNLVPTEYGFDNWDGGQWV